MGEYRCKLRTKLRPNSHDEWHWDGQSWVCPVLRDSMASAVENENWKRLKKLMKLLEETNPESLN